MKNRYSVLGCSNYIKVEDPEVIIHSIFFTREENCDAYIHVLALKHSHICFFLFFLISVLGPKRVYAPSYFSLVLCGAF